MLEAHGAEALPSPAGSDGRTAIRVGAKAGPVEATLAVPLRSGAATSATVPLDQGTAREGDPGEVTVELRDACGNPVPGGTIEILAEGADADPPHDVR
jgi:hypothetical protein